MIFNYLFSLMFFQETDIIRFEMDENGLSKMLQSLKDIEQQIDKHCK